MSPANYQTVTLSKGKHSSPDEGACVLELASMLAGEPFSDHPYSVCPVIGSFLRAYNDSVGDIRRQDLYAYASKVVGSRGSDDVMRARAERLLAWAADLHRHHWSRFFLPPRLRAVGLRREPPIEAVGTHAVHAIPRHTDETHASVLALIDELLSIGAGQEFVAGEHTPATRVTASV